MNKKSKFFWIYSITLFSIAFVLILFSAFTGIRNRDERSATANLYQGAKSSIEDLTKTNENITNENVKKQQEIDEMKVQNAEKDKSLTEAEEKLEKTKTAYEYLAEAQNLIDAGHYSDAKDLINKIDPSYLDGSGKNLFERIRKKF